MSDRRQIWSAPVGEAIVGLTCVDGRVFAATDRGVYEISGGAVMALHGMDVSEWLPIYEFTSGEAEFAIIKDGQVALSFDGAPLSEPNNPVDMGRRWVGVGMGKAYPTHYRLTTHKGQTDESD